MKLRYLDDDAPREVNTNPTVVALVVTPCDVKVKEYALGGMAGETHIVYRNWRWGKNATTHDQNADWWPMEGQRDEIAGEPFPYFEKKGNL